ncbi:MAG: hypothetical protein APF77_05330 [Clostridia bacterium BRH_c25]|nr:MAG: hypothetical protein APF77_05330 [Clostridia bacterium BRH_c25]
MRLTAIEIKNFRQYQSLFFQFPKNTDYDLHIIVADNGVGKTNILNSITWCLYGEEPHLGNESKSLPRLNLKAKNEAIQRDKSSVVVSVKIFAEDAGDIIIYSRKMNVKVETDFESKSELTVTMNSSGDAKIYTGDDAEAYIEKYMPKKIRQYFYFDGEQLDSYFISDESSKIKETIHAISQVDVVTRIKDRLGKIIISKQNEAGKKAPDVKEYNDALAKASEEISEIKNNIQELERQISISEAVIKTNTERLSGQENLPDLEAKYQRLQSQTADLEKRKVECLQVLFSFIREMKIDLSLYKSAKVTLDIINEKESQNALPPNIDRKLLRQILDNGDGLCLICDQPLSYHARDHIAEILEKIQVSSETSNLLMYIRSELERIVVAAENYPVKKSEVLKKYKDVCESLEQCEQDLQSVDNDISKFEDKQQVIFWHNERETHKQLLETNKKNKAVAEYQLKNALEYEQDIKDKLKKALEKAKECYRLNQMITFASEAKLVIENIEEEMMAEVRTKMEKRTMEYFSKLIWKKGVYDHITLDNKYQLDLFHRDGYSCVGSCSAAERSLLALSFTLALHEVSGFNSMLFIDTPVSRVTGQNRVNFANVLQHVSKEKQLIMAFTPDEYSENIRNIFKPIASTSVHLTMNDDNEITNIK